MAMAQIKETETTDEVIQETRRIKEVLAASLGFDIDRILQEAKEKQKKTGRKVLSPPVREDA
jgi:hypothetical protein